MIKCPICNSLTSFLIQKKDRFDQKYDYFRCENCRFLFEKDLVEHSEYLAKKVSNLYQKNYFDDIDSGWKMRGDEFLKFFQPLLSLYKFLSFKKNISVLDYGGGNGYIASKLAQDFTVLYYDKYDNPKIAGNYTILEKPQNTDVTCAVELVEHIADIKEWDFLKELSPDIFVFTTGLSDNITKEEILDWPYLNPDFGHTALYSCKSLYILGKKYGYIYLFFPNISYHMFFKNKILSKINFVFFEYFIYNILRMIKKYYYGK